MTNCLRARYEPALYVPDVKARDVKLTPGIPRGNTFPDELRLCYGVSAAVAGLPIARTVPHTRDSVVRKSALVDLSVDYKSKDGVSM